MSDRNQIRELIKFAGFIFLALVIGLGFFYREEIIPYIEGIISGKPVEHKKAEGEHKGHEVTTSQKTEGKPVPEGLPPNASIGGSNRGKERKILYWKDPMTPGYTSDKPGKSPFMDMDLVPVYEDEEGAAPGTVKIDPTTVQSIGVRTEKVAITPLRRSIRTVGRIDYDERKVTHIHTKIQGWVEKLYVDFTGKEVNEGDILLEVYSPELVSAQQEYLLALEYAKS
ncbi:MAG: efflux RND transporter periplasmic adaptor subunit, partial [Nitrospinae bacterium]|nr:efflux RND transporter periplasmic adaptor subunit [Nitrospinota bacterium]